MQFSSVKKSEIMMQGDNISPKQAHWAFEASPAPSVDTRAVHSKSKFQTEEEKCATWSGKYGSLIHSQARELTHLRQKMREGRGVGHVLTYQLRNTTKAFEELLQTSNIDVGIAQSFREQLAESTSLAQRVITKISGGECTESRGDKAGHHSLALRLTKELKEKDEIIKSLHMKLQQCSETPSSCHALSETSGYSDRTSVVSGEVGTIEVVELCPDVDSEVVHLQELVVTAQASQKQSELEAEQWKEELRRLQAHCQEQGQQIHTLRQEQRDIQENSNRRQHEASLLQQQLCESRDLIHSLQSELHVHHRGCSCTKARKINPLDPHSEMEGEPPDGAYANCNGRHAIGHVDDFSALQQQVLEGQSLVQHMEVTLQACLDPLLREDSQEQSDEPILDFARVKSLLSNTTTLRKILQEAVFLLKMFWRAALPNTDPSAQNLNREQSMQEEIVSLKLQISEQKDVMKEMIQRVRKTNGKKQSILSQLSRTPDVLKKPGPTWSLDEDLVGAARDRPADRSYLKDDRTPGGSRAPGLRGKPGAAGDRPADRSYLKDGRTPGGSRAPGLRERPGAARDQLADRSYLKDGRTPGGSGAPGLRGKPGAAGDRTADRSYLNNGRTPGGSRGAPGEARCCQGRAG